VKMGKVRKNFGKIFFGIIFSAWTAESAFFWSKYKNINKYEEKLVIYAEYEEKVVKDREVKEKEQEFFFYEYKIGKITKEEKKEAELALNILGDVLSPRLKARYEKIASMK